MLRLFLSCLLFVTINSENSKHSYRNVNPRAESLDSLYNVYDPSYLSVVWPTMRNGVHLAIGDDCFVGLKVFFKDYRKGRAWALIAADASGHYNSGAYSGRRHWPGSKRQCLDLDKNMNKRTDKMALEKLGNDVYLNSVLRKEFNRGQKWSSTSEQDKLMQQALAAVRSPPYRLAFSTVHLSLNITKPSMAKRHEIVQGLCLPRSCSPSDVEVVLKFSIVVTDTIKSNKTIPRTVKVSASRRVYDAYDLTKDKLALGLISITLILILLCVVATLVDYKLIKFKTQKTITFNVQKYNSNLKECERKSNLINMETLTINNMDNSKNINLVTVKKVMKSNVVTPSITLDVVSLENQTNSCKRCGKYKKQCVDPKTTDNNLKCPRFKYDSISGLSVKEKRSFFYYLLLCFSLDYSWKRIFNTNMANKDLSIMHGFRIVTTFWVVFVHLVMVVSYLSDNATDINSRHNGVYMTIVTGSLAFDTLFFVSFDMFWIHSGLFSSYHFFYLKSRYSVEELVSFGGGCGHVLQLVCFITNRAIRLLPSYTYTILLATVLGRVVHQTSVLELPGQDYNCGATWWRNILYLTNIYPTEDRCLQISWYLTTETQLHAAGALICAIAARPRAAFAIATLSVVAATAADVMAAYWEYGVAMPDAFVVYQLIMERPWSRVAPYFVGVFGGWLVCRKGGKLTVTRRTSNALWVASLAALTIASALPWVGPAWTTAWLHLVWPTVLLWPAFVCATDYAELCRRLLDSSMVAALSRLCYSILLLHGIVTRTALLSLDGPLCSEPMCIWLYFTGTTLLTVLTSLLLSLLVEMPCCSLLRRLSDCASS